ncbi:MAG: NUDIX hydrolase [Sarcina sp.]
MKLLNVDKLTDCKFLNLYKLNLTNKKGNPKAYFVASRRKEEELSAITKNHGKADAVMIIPITEKKELILLKQYRPAISDYIYEFPAGLVDKGEDMETAAVRELYEETGLKAISTELFLKSSYTSVGMSDESVAVVKMTVTGEPTSENSEEDEEIEIIKIPIETAKEFIKNNNVSIKTALAILTI